MSKPAASPVQSKTMRDIIKMSPFETPGDYLQYLRESYKELYLKELNVGIVKFKKIKKLLDNMNHSASQRSRITERIAPLKYYLMFPRINIITTCFKVKFDSVQCIYGFVYTKFDTKGEFKTAYLCAGSTYQSQDGEYRRRILLTIKINAIFERYKKIIDMIEAMIIDHMEKGRLSFEATFHYPADTYELDKAAFEESINRGRWAIRIFIMCWVTDFYMIHNNMIENHINPIYQFIIYQRESIELYDKIMETTTSTEFTTMRISMDTVAYRFDHPEGLTRKLRCGQKIFPLTVYGAIREENINFMAWREIYITNLCSNLALNFICGGFSFIGCWFYIQNSSVSAFDNKSLHEQYSNSATAKDISRQLKIADKLNYQNSDKTNPTINSKFMKLSHAIQRAMMVSESEIVLTDAAICVVSEYVGYPVRDWPRRNMEILRSCRINKADPDNLANIGLFTKHMFEFVYNLYCMHSRTFIIHGDLHMNNVTMCSHARIYEHAGEIKMIKPYVLYIIDPDTVFMFPHNGMYGTIIDFSRSMIGDYDKISNEFGHRYAEMYFYDQRLRMLNFIYTYFPDVIDKYGSKIETLLLENYALMFKILSAIDIYVLFSNMSIVLEHDELFVTKKLSLAPGGMKLVNSMRTKAKDFFLRNIADVAEGKINDPSNIEWPALLIINEYFKQYLINSDKDIADAETITICDVFNYTNPLKYDIEDPESWGPILSMEPERKYNKDIGATSDSHYENYLAHIREIDKEPTQSISERYSNAAKDVFGFERWMLL